MTRFMRELNGSLGAYWQRSAEKELEAIKADLASGKITIDDSGVARNCIGRVLMEDLLEKVALVTDRVDPEATKAARAAEVERELAEYRASYKGPSAEERAEMRAAFGPGTKVVNVITGDEIEL